MNQSHLPAHTAFQFVAALLLVFVSAACSSMTTITPPSELHPEKIQPGWQPLPFHVAVIPLAEDALEKLSAEHGDLEIRFLDEERDFGEYGLTQQVRSVLDRSVFNVVEVLEEPESLPEGWNRDRYFAQQAALKGADVLLDFERLWYKPQVESSTNTWNWVLFLFGPLEFLVPDRTYRCEKAALAVSLYDVATMELPDPTGSDGFLAQGEFRLRDAATTLRQFRLSPGSQPLRLKDRMPDGVSVWSNFPKMLVIPSARLYRSGPSLAEELSHRFSRDLAIRLGEAVVRGDSEFILNPDVSLASYRFDPRGMKASRMGDTLVLQHQIRGSDPSRLFLEAAIAVGKKSYVCEYRDPDLELEAQLALGKGLYSVSQAQGDLGAEWDIDFYLPGALAKDSFSAEPHASILKIRMSDFYNARRQQTWTLLLGDV